MTAVRSAGASFAPPVGVILGPTGLGKSAIAIEAAKRLDGEIISADSRAFFRGLDIATDKPSCPERRGVPHHLIDIIAINGSYDAMAFRNDVDRLVPEIGKRQHLPVIVGGGTLYLGAILRGLFVGPCADARIRERLARQPLEELYSRLTQVDSIRAAQVHPHDRQRIVRALEVYEVTGQPISRLQQETTPLPYRFVRFGLRRAKADHRAAIAARVEKMLAAGLIDEIERLRAQGLTRDCQAYRSIGVREVFAFLEGKINYTQLREALLTHTWALARRQMAWFANDQDVHWIDVTGCLPAQVAEKIAARLRAAIKPG